ncbi:hypothetical protein NAF17_09690 [Mucilaginibacter sp. RB4R14]|uniref:hypothetical protein n=1 Tax=Mucilaginibacter aurantiaciroseus TaxID=2949308 RepID=UPI0020914090|nr:hypothetical protein [Mucilaginibacter aurantiaciroseus]MCO5935815.1 hypothetical protein [Mucilaginibacter aurantiaciroseus]
MKKLIYLLILLAACKSPEKKVAAVEKDTVQKAKPADTTFLWREVKKDVYHAVYIEKDRNASQYKWLLGFKYDHNDSINYNETYKILKVKHFKPLKKYDLAGLPKQWVPLNLYKGKYYLYAPGDGGNTRIRAITDSTIIYYDMDGPTVQALLDFKKLKANKYFLKSPPFYQFVRSSNVTIYIIDPKNMVTVWEDTSLPFDYRYTLYVAKEHAAKFDMVVNYSKMDKMPEFDFDKINYKKLIKGL